jgi:hypothetical protein
MKKLFEKGKNIFDTAAIKLTREVDSRMHMVKEIVNGLPIFVSFERLKNPTLEYDEKHYFIIPFHSCEAGFSLHTMRSLPAHVPEINDLPKRRVFHFPNEHYEATLRVHMVNTAKDIAYGSEAQNVSSLEMLANKIDALDSKLTYGILIIGGIAAIFNPLVGAGIAAKAIFPGVAGLLSSYGLRPLGEKLTQSQLENQVKNAEQKVLKQFSEANTLKVTNPILHQLEYALRTTEMQYDPLLDPNLSPRTIPQLGDESWRQLTEKAIFHVYRDVVEDTNKHEAARLGPEDIRWLKLLFVGNED